MESTVTLTYREFLARIPKVELHCHFPGTIAATTALDLANKNGIELPTNDPAELYSYTTITGFLGALQAVSKTLVEPEDFARVAYETLAAGAQTANLRYREMFFNPDYHTPQGVTYIDMVAGMADGIDRAHREFGVRCGLIAAVSRFHGPDVGVAMVQTVLDHPHPRVIGIGMDDLTPDGEEAPEAFVDAYALATSNGLRTTAHVAEIDGSSPRNYLTAIDVLGCDRVDHGYRILLDPEVLDRARNDGTHITTCPHSSSWLYGFDMADHPIKAMFDHGLNISLNSDDPPFFDTDIGQEFVAGAPAMGFTPAEVEQLCLNAVDGSWLPEADKAALRAEFVDEIGALRVQLAGGLDPS